MLKRQPHNYHYFRLNITSNRKYILRPEKNGFVVQNPLCHIVCNIAFYIFLAIKYETFGVTRSMRAFWQKKNDWMGLCAPIS